MTHETTTLPVIDPKPRRPWFTWLTLAYMFALTAAVMAWYVR